jgi:hypothetical protein
MVCLAPIANSNCRVIRSSGYAEWGGSGWTPVCCRNHPHIPLDSSERHGNKISTPPDTSVQPRIVRPSTGILGRDLIVTVYAC